MVYDTSNKPFNWSMMAKNLDSEEKIKIDKSDFTSNDYNVPMFVEYVPTGPKIKDAMISTINLFDDYVMVIAQYWEKEDIVTEYELVELK